MTRTEKSHFDNLFLFHATLTRYHCRLSPFFHYVQLPNFGHTKIEQMQKLLLFVRFLLFTVGIFQLENRFSLILYQILGQICL